MPRSYQMYTPEQKDEAVRLYVQGMTAQQVAESTGMNIHSVTTLMRNRRVGRHVLTGPEAPLIQCRNQRTREPRFVAGDTWRGKKLTAAVEKKMLDARTKQGMSAIRIAQIYDIDYTRVRRFLAAHGVASKKDVLANVSLDEHNGSDYRHRRLLAPELLKKQGGKCALCRCPLTIDQAHVDHCHKANRVRAVLCRPCNFGLGMFKDNVLLLQRAADYIKKHRPPLKNRRKVALA